VSVRACVCARVYVCVFVCVRARVYMVIGLDLVMKALEVPELQGCISLPCSVQPPGLPLHFLPL